MPSADCDCFVCSKTSNANNICGHLMTHRKDLVPHIVKSTNLFAIVRDLNPPEGKSPKEYYCCFGCKKQYADKTRMRDHMEKSDGCLKKHKEFLQDIGFESSHLELEIKEYQKERIKLLTNEVESLRRQLAEAKTTKVEDLEKEIAFMANHIHQMEEVLLKVPYFMKPEDWAYVQRWINAYKSAEKNNTLPGGVVTAYHKKLLGILQECPLLQVCLFPSFIFLRNSYNPENGDYQTVNGNYFHRHFTYRPRQRVEGDPDYKPKIPAIQDNVEIPVAAEETSENEETPITNPVVEKQPEPRFVSVKKQEELPPLPTPAPAPAPATAPPPSQTSFSLYAPFSSQTQSPAVLQTTIKRKPKQVIL